jgi:hypothetical protein
MAARPFGIGQREQHGKQSKITGTLPEAGNSAAVKRIQLR